MTTQQKTINFNPAIVCGIELELEYNEDILGYITKGNYHDNSNFYSFGKHFKAEQDGSLFTTTGNGDTVELISAPFYIKDNKKVLLDFKEECYKRIAKEKGISSTEAKKKFKLKDFLKFNGSTGAHLHFTVLNKDKKGDKLRIRYAPNKYKTFTGLPLNVKNVFNYDFIQHFNKKLESAVKKKIPETAFKTWKKGLNRDYAKKFLSSEDFILEKYDRTREFNLTGNTVNIEYRSFNLRGVKTWKDFFKIYEVLFKTLNTCINAELRQKRPFNQKAQASIINTVFEPKQTDSKKIHNHNIKAGFFFKNGILTQKNKNLEVK